MIHVVVTCNVTNTPNISKVKLGTSLEHHIASTISIEILIVFMSTIH